MAMAEQRGLEVQFELGKKHAGEFTSDAGYGASIAQGREWARGRSGEIVVEARESARGVGLFDDDGQLNRAFAERFAATEFGLETGHVRGAQQAEPVRAPRSFRSAVRLSNVRLEEFPGSRSIAAGCTASGSARSDRERRGGSGRSPVIPRWWRPREGLHYFDRFWNTTPLRLTVTDTAPCSLARARQPANGRLATCTIRGRCRSCNCVLPRQRSWFSCVTRGIGSSPGLATSGGSSHGSCTAAVSGTSA